MSNTNPFSNLLVSSPGKAYSQSQVVSWSHYNDPIVTGPGIVSGNSHIWGDASAAVQMTCINALIQAAANAGLDTNETGLLLSIVYVESGFNPDAAAGTTSASGLGQFTKGTGVDYGLTSANMWDVTAQAQAAVDYFIDCSNKVANRDQNTSSIYAYWHDGLGTSGAGPGLGISNANVMPLVSQFETALNQGSYGLSSDDTTPSDGHSLITEPNGTTVLQTNYDGTNFCTIYNPDGSSVQTTSNSFGINTYFYDATGLQTLPTFTDTTLNTSVSTDSAGNTILTSTAANGGTNTVTLSSTGAATLAADNHTISFGAGQLLGVSVDPSGNAVATLDPSTSNGLSRTVEITSSGETVIEGGTAVGSAPITSVTVDGSGDVSFNTNPVAGVTETTTLGANGSVNGVLQSTTSGGGSCSIDVSTSPSTGLLTPASFDIDNINWNNTTTTLANYVTQTTGSIDNSNSASTQTQTQGTINADNTAIASGSISNVAYWLQPFVLSDMNEEDQNGSTASNLMNFVATGQDVKDSYQVPYGSGGSTDNGGNDDDTNDDGQGGSNSGDGGWGSGGGGDVESNDPLVFSISRQGINLESLTRSEALYDFTGSGTPLPTGWTGSGTAFIVFANNNNVQLPTFSSLAALDTNHGGVINASDPGFSELEVWNDANGNGVVDPGELETLAQAGIASISTSSTPVNVSVGGNLVLDTGTITFADGTTEALDQVAFATQGGVALNGMNNDAIAVLQRVANGNEAKAVGDANAVVNSVVNSITGILAPLEAADGNMASALSASKPDPYPYKANTQGGANYTQGTYAITLSSSQVNIITETSQLLGYMTGVSPVIYATDGIFRNDTNSTTVTKAEHDF